MDLNALKLFVEIVDAGSLSAAARRLNTSRSNVSQRLKLFEQAIGAQLLRRSTRRTEPTQLGYTLYEHGSNIIRELAGATAAVSTLGKSLHGHLRVSIPTALGQLHIAPLLIEFAQRYPDITLEVVFSNRIVDLMASRIDVALRVTSEPPEQYVARELARMDWVLCASPAYVSSKGAPRKPGDLAQHVLVTSTIDTGNRLAIKLTRQDQVSEIAVQPRIQSQSFVFLKDAVLAGLGLGVLPYYAVHRELGDGSLVRMLADYGVDVWGDRLFLITAPNLYPTLAARSLIEFLKTRIPQLPVLRVGAIGK
jgi:DNA-binding transcriptional LysR family regulator